MAYGIIGYGQPGQVNSTSQVGTTQSLISGSIFGDCSSQELTDEGTGFFVNKNFKDDTTAPGLPVQGGTWTFGTAGDSIVNVVYTSTANVIAFVRPMAPIAPNGQTKLWYEVSVQPAQTTSQYMFFGFANSTGLSSTVFSTGVALAASTGLIGFWMHADAPTNLDAVYHGQTVQSTTTVLANVLTANANNPNPANLAFVPAVAPGAFTGSKLGEAGPAYRQAVRVLVCQRLAGGQEAHRLDDGPRGQLRGDHGLRYVHGYGEREHQVLPHTAAKLV